MQYTRHLEAPDSFHFWSGVAAIAGALRGKVWIDMGFFQWKPNFFIIFVAKPGMIQKSTSMGIGMDLLRQVEGIHFGPNSTTWQAITDSFIESSTTVMMSDGNEYIMSALTVAASELGTFLDPKNRDMIDILVDLWDGKNVPWQRATRGEGIKEILNPWLNIIGAVTPAWLENNFPEYAIGGGFTSRTIFVFADRKRQFTAYPSLSITKEDADLEERLVHDLRLIAEFKGEYKLLPETYKWGTDWYASHWESAGSIQDDRLQGYLARKQTHIHKVAMIIAASYNNEMVILPEDLQKADILVTALEADMARVFERVSDNSQTKYITTILSILRGTKRITKQSLWRSVMHSMSLNDFDLALNGIIHAGYAKAISEGNKMYIIPNLEKK
jgi:hypothetical protein